MRVEAPVFAYEPSSIRTMKPAPARFESVLNERIEHRGPESSASSSALESGVEQEIEEPTQDSETSEMTDEQTSEQALDGQTGGRSDQDEANFSTELIDEVAIEELVAEDAPSEQALAASQMVAIPLEALNEAGTLQRAETPLVSGWSQAFSAQPVEAEQATSELVLKISEDALTQQSVTPELSGGSVRLPEGMVAIQPELLAPLDLASPQATDRLQDLVELQIRASKSPAGAKQLSLTLNPEGLGRLRILAQTDGDKMRLMLKVEQGDAARLIERVLPQLEAQIAASVAMPVEFELVQEEILANDTGLQLGDFADQEGHSDEAESGEEGDLVDQWTKQLEEPVLDLGQTLHVVA